MTHFTVLLIAVFTSSMDRLSSKRKAGGVVKLMSKNDIDGGEVHPIIWEKTQKTLKLL